MTRVSWAQVRKLLCIRLDSLGDVLMCTPAMRAAKESLPQCTLTLLASPAGAEAARYIPEVDAVLEYEAPWVKGSAPRTSSADTHMIAHLAAQQFDAAVIFTSYSQSALPAALMCYLAGIPLRLAHSRENPYRLLTHPVAESEPGKLVRHEVRRQLDLVAEVGWMSAGTGLSFSVPAASRTAAGRWLAACGIGTGQRFILLHPGASAASRRYPAPLWGEVIRALHARCGHPLVLTGGTEERDMVEGIRATCGALAHSLAGLLDLGDLGGAIARAAVVISNNTGPAHMAAAVGASGSPVSAAVGACSRLRSTLPFAVSGSSSSRTTAPGTM